MHRFGTDTVHGLDVSQLLICLTSLIKQQTYIAQFVSTLLFLNEFILPPGKRSLKIIKHVLLSCMNFWPHREQQLPTFDRHTCKFQVETYAPIAEILKEHCLVIR